MTISHQRRTHRPGVALASTLAAVFVALALAITATATLAVEPTDSPNRLDQPMADVALVESADADAPPRLLVVDAFDEQPNVATIRLLERTQAWESVAETSIDFGTAGSAAHWLDARWLIGLGAARFVLIGTADSPERSMVVGLRIVDEPGGRAVEETGRIGMERHIGDAGAADVDGDGTLELLLSPSTTPSAACSGSALSVYDGTTLALSSTIPVANRLLGSGVIGPFDDVPGDELLVYADEECYDAGSLDPVHVLAVRLADGTTIFDGPSAPHYDDSAVGPPLRIDLDGTVPDEAVAVTADGLSILDPSNGWASIPIGTDRAIPLVAGADADAAGPAVRVGWSEPREGVIAAERYRRGPAGAIEASGGSALDISADTDRWDLMRRAVIDGAARHEPALGYLGGAVDEGCPDILVPLGLQPCGADAFRSGPAWIGTRPIVAMSAGGQRRLLVAAGLGWGSDGGLPPSPAPWAAGPAGWWRHGPSVPFALSEIRASDATYFREFPVPLVSIEADTTPAITTAIPGFTGTRLFVRATAVGDDAELPAALPSALAVLDGTPDPSILATVVRVPVPPGVESARDGGFATVDLTGATMADGSAATRWMLDVVPLNDWGELGDPARRIVARDAIGPNLTVETPFSTAVWPIAAELRGSSDLGSTVIVDGVGEMELDRRGRFTFETTLAPWPQTLRVTATDPSGNVTVQEVSVIGGVDYRRFPWPFIAAVALLTVVAARGVLGERRTGKSARPSRRETGGFDDGPGAEIEELPPGGGLAPR